MERAGYQGLEEHRRKHCAMVVQVEGFASDITSGTPDTWRVALPRAGGVPSRMCGLLCSAR